MTYTRRPVVEICLGILLGLAVSLAAVVYWPDAECDPDEDADGS